MPTVFIKSITYTLYAVSGRQLMILVESKWDYEKNLWICDVLDRGWNGNYVFYRNDLDCGDDHIHFTVMRISFVLLLVCPNKKTGREKAPCHSQANLWIYIVRQHIFVILGGNHRFSIPILRRGM